MSEKVCVELGPVQETLLIPLLGRAKETQRKRGILNDEKAVRIVEQLDYDFSKWQGVPSLTGASIRTKMMDQDVQDFLKCYPDSTVVEIGAGLNTRFERLDNIRANWLELDLPDSMALRKKFFTDSERRQMIIANVLEDEWLDQVAEYPGPYCFVSEAVLIYLDNADAEQVIRKLSKRFPGSWFITDTTSTVMVKGQDKHDVMKKMSEESWFRWCCDNPSSLGEWGLQLKRSRSFMQATNDMKKLMPWRYRLMFKLIPWYVRKKVDGYRINRFVFNG